ncbi:MAG: CHAD domain-containing protein [Steroidobacteraceae bacterium]
MRTVRRLLVRELESAVARLEKGPPSDHAVHEIRKELKRVRAILRLLRPCLGVRAYRRENAVVRDAAQPLTPLRDAAILPQALRQLQARPRGKNDGAFMRYLHGVLRQEHCAAHRQLQGRDLKAAVRELRAFKRRIEMLPASRLDRATPSSGLIRTYKSGRNALASVTLQATDEHLHEWRKQVTYLANQLECIAPPDSQRFAARLDRFRRLARHLGDDHDLAVLNRKILEIAKPSNASAAAAPRRNVGVQDLESRVARRREALQSKAFRLGQRLYTRRPRRLAAAWAPILAT